MGKVGTIQTLPPCPTGDANPNHSGCLDKHQKQQRYSYPREERESGDFTSQGLQISDRQTFLKIKKKNF